MRSMSPSITGIRLKFERKIVSRSSGRSASTTNMSARGVMISDTRVSSNSKMLWISCFSRSLMSPPCTAATIVSSSASVTLSPPGPARPPPEAGAGDRAQRPQQPCEP